MIKAVVCALAWLAGSARGQQAPSEARPAYQPFRYDEDWSNLADGSMRSDWLDPPKYISLGRSGWFVGLGGEAREKLELIDQPGFGAGPEDNTGYFLQRYLLSSDFHFGRRMRFFQRASKWPRKWTEWRAAAHGPRPAGSTSGLPRLENRFLPTLTMSRSALGVRNSDSEAAA
jgi:hypothetical protein